MGRSKQTDDLSSGYQAPAVQKAFQLLKIVAGSRNGMGLSELANHLGYSKSTTHGLIQALRKEGVVDQSPNKKRVFLGHTIVDLAFKSRNYFRVSEQAQPVLNSLRDAINETVFLGALSSTRGIIIATAEATRPYKISSPTGTSIPLLAGAVGKVFLAGMDDVQAIKIIEERGLTPYTPKSIVEKSAYLEELALVREQGYALDNEEYLPGVKAVAVSLGRPRGLPMALWTVGFAGSIDNGMLPEIIKHTIRASRLLQNALNEDDRDQPDAH